MGPLGLSNLETVNNNWDYSGGPDATEMLGFMIANLPSVGIWNADGELVAHEVTSPGGLHVNLFVDEKYRGRGFAKIVTLELARQMTEIGIVPATLITIDNTISQKLHERCGYTTKKNQVLSWLHSTPNELPPSGCLCCM